MRTFAEQLRADGFTVDYIQLDDARQQRLAGGWLARARARATQPERIGVVANLVSGGYVDFPKRRSRIGPSWSCATIDRFFFLLAGEFRGLGQGSQAAAQEAVLHREMRKHKLQLLMDPRMAGPAGGAWNL